MTGMKKTKLAATNSVTRAKNAAVVAQGRAKAATGTVLGDRKLEMTGELESAKGRVAQVGRKIKGSLGD